jgi:hypothetical protein
VPRRYQSWFATVMEGPQDLGSARYGSARIQIESGASLPLVTAYAAEYVGLRVV